MATYRTTRCPHCKYALEFMTPFAKEYIGHPINICPRCKEPFKTGMNYWFEMNGGEKAWYMFTQGFLAIYSGMFYAVGASVAALLIGYIFLGVGVYALIEKHLILFISLYISLSLAFFAKIAYDYKCRISEYSDPKIRNKLSEAIANRTTL